MPITQASGWISQGPGFWRRSTYRGNQLIIYLPHAQEYMIISQWTGEPGIEYAKTERAAQRRAANQLRRAAIA